MRAGSGLTAGRRCFVRGSLATTVVLATPCLTRAKELAYTADDFPYPPTATFAVLRNGQPIGWHKMAFAFKDGRLSVTSDVEMKVAGLVGYRYVQHVHEEWQGGQLLSLTAKTDDNGKVYAVRAKRTAAGLAVEREQPPSFSDAAAAFAGFTPPEVSRQTVSASVLPTSNWNVEQVHQTELLNTQYGVLSHTKIVSAGRELVKTAHGTIAATRYTYSGDLQADQWFDDRGRWVKASFNVFDGSTIEYVLQE